MSTANEVLAKAQLTPGSGQTLTVEVPAIKTRDAERITAWIRPDGQAVTATLRARMPEVGGARQEGEINGSPDVIAVACGDGEWTPLTIEHSMVGDLLVDVIAGGSAPNFVDVFVAGLVD